MDKLVRIVFGLLISVCLATPAGAVLRGVICGVADYKRVNDLAYTDNDARGIYRWLKTGTATKHLTRLIDKGAKKAEIKKACKDMAAKAKSGDVCVFYFSGHGTYGPDRAPFDESDHYDEYLCAWDSSFGSYAYDIRDDRLERWLAPIADKGANAVVILDTCYSGGAIKRKANFFGSKTEVLVKTKGGATYGQITDGFARDLDKPGFVVMTACDDDEVSYEYSWFQHGVFTYFVLMAATGPADDSRLIGGIGDNNGVITDMELWNATLVLDDLFYDFMGPGSLNQNPQLFDGMVGDVEIIDME